MKTNLDKWALLGALLIFLLFLAACFLFPLPSHAQKTDDLRPQVVLVFNHKQADKLIVAVKAQPVLQLRQEDPTAQLAPIEPGTLMLCRPYSEGNHLTFRCGQDKFVMDAISFIPEKP
jgi:hypothetical protein